nr:PREDICTED: extended synaptotagmin-1 [Lepisosteus oculatus]
MRTDSGSIPIPTPDEVHAFDPPVTPGADAVSVLWSFGKCLGALIPVYLAGYFGFSIMMVVFGLMVYTGWKLTREGKETRLRSAMYLLENEEEITATRVLRTKREMPAWVSFPDVEKAEWLNKILQQAWPFLGQYVEKLLLETIAPIVRASSPHLQTLSFTKINLGEKALKVVGVKAHTENDKRQVLLDLYLSYVGDVEINVEIKKYFCKAGVKGIQLHGMLRVILEPLIGDVPLVGAITMFFIRRPRLDINWTGMTNLLDIPGLNSFSDTLIMDAIASHLVLPNRLTVPLVANLHVAQLRSPLPRGIVRIHLLEAEALAAKDTKIKGLVKGKSDPYAVVRVGTQTFTSRTIDDDLNPQWRELYEVIVHEVPGQELELEVFDKDPDQDDFLGRMKSDLGCVKQARVLDDWFPLMDTETGSVHLRLEWLSLLPSADKLDEVLQRNRSFSTQKAEPPSAAILAVYLDRAQELPLKKGNKDPSPMVQLSVQDTTRESRTCYGTHNPVWEDAFVFFIQDPRRQDIDIQVKDDDRSLTLGSLSIPLSRLLTAPDLSLDQWFQLDSSGSASRIYMNIILRILWLDDNVSPSAPVSPHPSVPVPMPAPGGAGQGEDGMGSVVNPGGVSVPPSASATLPQHTSPGPSFATEGVLRIHLVEAQNLIAKDNFLGRGKSDPYVVIRTGGMTFRSRVIKENLNPTWNELYEVILTEVPGQEVQFEVFDKDLDQDDFLGRLKISLRDIITSQYIDEWFTLSEVKSGRLHMTLEWLPRVTDPARLDQVLRLQSKSSYQNKVVPAAALLSVFVDRAHALPLKKSGKEPKAGAELILQSNSHRTKVCERSTSPLWEEAFSFLVHDPQEDMLIVKLSHSWGMPLGSLVLPLREILFEPDLVLDRWFNLDGAKPESQLLLRATMKILDSRVTECGLGDRSALDKAPAGLEGEVQEQPVPSPEKPTANQDLRHRSVPTQGDGEQGHGAPGQVKLSLSYSREENRLVIIIHACRQLAACAKDGSDPYISFSLLPDKNKSTKRKTSVKKRDLNPEYNERFDFELSLAESQKRKLELFVKNSVSFMSRERELIGKVQIDLAQVDLSAGVTQWYDLKQEAH